MFSQEAYLEFHFYEGYVSMVCCVVGAVFSIINVVVYLRQSDKRGHATNGKKLSVGLTFLAAVCVADCGFTLSKFVGVISSIVLQPWDQVCVHLNLWMHAYLAAICRRVAIVVNALASLERFLAISFPLAPVSSLLLRRPVVVAVVVAVLTLVAHSYFFLEFQIIPVTLSIAPSNTTTSINNNTNTTSLIAANTSVLTIASGSDLQNRYRLSFTVFGLKHTDSLQMYKHAVRAVFFYIPLLASMGFNAALVLVLRKHAASKHGLRSDRGTVIATTHKADNDVDDLHMTFKTSDFEEDRGKYTSERGSNKHGNRKSPTAATNSKTTETKAATFIVVVTLTFVLLALPTTLNFTVSTFVADYGTGGVNEHLRTMLSDVFDIPQFLTQFALFLVSMRSSKRFRETVYGLFREGCPWLRSSRHGVDQGGSVLDSGGLSQGSTVTSRCHSTNDSF